MIAKLTTFLGLALLAAALRFIPESALAALADEAEREAEREGDCGLV